MSTANNSDRLPLTYGGLKRWLGLLLLLGLSALVAWHLKPVLLLFALVFLVAMVLNPLVAFLQGKGLRRPIGVALLAVVFVVLFVLAIWFLIPAVLDQADELLKQFPKAATRVQSEILDYSHRYPEVQNLVPEANQMFNAVGGQVGDLMQLLAKSTFRVVGSVFDAIIAILLLLFVLINPEPVVAGYLKLVPAEHRESAKNTLSRLAFQMAAWARGVLINGTITAITTGLLLSLIGVQPALFFGVLAFLGEFLPMIGPLIMAFPAVFVALGMGPEKFGLTVLVYLFVQQVETNLLVPFVLGKAMDLSPISILFFTLSMTSLFGLTGAILAVPTAALFKIVLDEFYFRHRSVDEIEIKEEAKKIILYKSDSPGS